MTLITREQLLQLLGSTNELFSRYSCPSSTLMSATISRGRNECCSKQVPFGFNVFRGDRKFFPFRYNVRCKCSSCLFVSPLLSLDLIVFTVCVKKNFVFLRVSKFSKSRQLRSDQLTTHPLF